MKYEYDVIEQDVIQQTIDNHPSSESFKRTVAEYLSKGWELAGGIFVIERQDQTGETHTKWYQSIIKKTNK